jgi:PKD repeat protein
MKNRFKALLIAIIIGGFPSINAQQLTPKNVVPLTNNTIQIQNVSNGHYQLDLSNQPHNGHCLSDQLMNDYLQQTGLTQWYQEEQEVMQHAAQHPQEDRATYTIPIVFHVIYNNAQENISNADIQQILAEINEDYQLQNADASQARTNFGFIPSNADIDFCLAQRDPTNQPMAEPGVHRVATNVTYFDPNTNGNDMKYTSTGGTEAWDRNKYLNVWICDITNGANSGIAGYAYRPGINSIGIPSDIDGIVIDYNLGTQPNGNVLTHEIGHFLGLSHTWGNSNQASGCSDDDGLTDTPNTAGPSFDYPGSCSGNQTTCGTTQTQYENYMDYSNCTVMFTTEQTNLMSAVLANSRNSLTTSNACTPINPLPPVANFSADITTVIAGGSVNFTDLSTNYPSSWQWTITPSTGTSYIVGSSTSQNVTIQFSNVGTYTIALTATNAQGSNTETKNNYINVIASGGGTLTCDTLRNYTLAEEANMANYSVTNEAGYYPGNHTLSSGAIFNQGVAEPFNVGTSTEVRAIRLPIFQVDDMGAADNLTLNVYTDNAGQPGSVLGSQTIPLSNLNAGFWNVLEFNTGVVVNGNFWVGMSWDVTGAFDTLRFATVDFNDRTGATSTTMSDLTGGTGWYNSGTMFGGINTSLIMDVLTSTGPAPVANISAPTQACADQAVPMNAYGSTNANSYYWLLDDAANSGPYYDNNANTNYQYWTSTWTIELHALGSCREDIATSTLNVYDSITSNINVTDETCSSADGQIDFTLTNGGVPPYLYSINNGASTQTNTLFSNLSAGTYNLQISDAIGCELTQSQTINSINNFTVTATATPSTNINAGETVTLNASAGGISYTWFEGNVTYGNTQSVTTSPSVTTTFIVNAVDANGCEASDQITINVNNVGISENELGKYISIYPNPTTDIINISFSFESAKNLKIELFDINSKVINYKTFKDIKSDQYQVDLSNLAEGVYFVKINDGTTVYTSKITIVK